MITHSVIVALLAAIPAASPETSAGGEPTTVKTGAPARTGQQLRDAVHAAMRQQATAKGTEQAAAVRSLTDIYQDVVASTVLPSREQRQLRTQIRSRLMRTSKTLERQLAKAQAADEPQVRPPADQLANEQPPANRAILAQAQGNPARQAGAAGAQAGRAAGRFGPGGQVAGAAQNWNAQTNQNAQQLIDLIQNTIAPASWETNGGLGTIMYFAPSQVLVIRQTDAVQGQVGQAIQGLRRN
jgi:hypothetical protein